jgi:hypothetical protein
MTPSAAAIRLICVTMGGVMPPYGSWYLRRVHTWLASILAIHGILRTRAIAAKSEVVPDTRQHQQAQPAIALLEECLEVEREAYLLLDILTHRGIRP